MLPPDYPISERPDPPQPPDFSADELLDAQPWGVLVLDAQGTIRRVNQLAARWCGAPPAALLGQPLRGATLPPTLGTTLRQLLEPGAAAAREVFLPQHEQWVSFSAQPQAGGWVLYGQDITPQKQREQQYQTLAENTPDVLTRWTPDLRLRYANAAFATKTGLPVAALLGQTFAEMGAPAAITGPYMVALQRVFDTGQPQEHYNPFVGPRGTVYYHSRLVPELRDGAIETVLGIARDITELQQTQLEALHLRDELMQHATDQYHALFYTMDQGFCVLEVLFDASGEQAVDFRYLELNPVFARQSGMPADVQGKTVRALLPDLEPFWFETYGQVVRTGHTVRVEHYVPQVGRWFDVHAFRVGPPEARRVAVLFNDITARKQQAQQQAFLLRFSDTLRAETSATRVAYQALEMLCEQLQLDRCYIGIYDFAEDRGIFPQQVGNERIPPLPAEVRLSDFPDALRVAHDRTLVIDDLAHTAGLSDMDRHNLGALGMRALVAATLRRGAAGPQWAIIALSADVRHWTPGEVALLEEATERTWAAVEHARAEAALHQSEEELRLLVTTTSDTVYRMSADCTQLEQLISQDFLADTLRPSRTWTTNYIPDEDLPGVQAAIVDAIARKGPLELEHRVQQANGTVGWAHSRAVPVLDAQGEVTSWLGAATNITARKQAEEALRQAEESHRTELEERVAQRTQQLQESRDLLHGITASQAAIITAFTAIRDATGHIVDLRFIFVNAAGEQRAGGYPLVGERYLAMYPEAERTGHLDTFRRVVETGVAEEQELAYDDGKLTGWFRTSATRLGDGVLAITDDITARKLAEQERLKNLRLLEQAEAVANLGSWDYNLLTRQFSWSDGMYHLFGLPLGQPVAPRVYLDYVIDEDRPRAEQLVACIVAGTDSFEATLRLRVGAQVKTVRIKSVVFYNETGEPTRVLGVDLDISELQRLEADNLRLRLSQQRALFEAVQAAQETERGRMAESLHNGIGQLLYATKLRLDRLHAPVLDTDPALAAARHEADQLLGEAIRHTRALSHELVPIVLEEFGLAQALRDIGRKMSTPQLRLRTHVLLDEAAAPLTLALQLALYRMAQELAQNIVKHALGATEASLELETTPGWVLLRAEDNGPGFAPAPAERPGLGLRGIRDRVVLLEGQLEMGALPEGGAYVRIRIPLSTSPAL